MKINIRPATVEDALAIANLHIASWQQNYQKNLTKAYLTTTAVTERRALWLERLKHASSNQRVLVADLDNQIVGFACLYIEQNEQWGSYLDNLHVMSKYQANGIGKKLLIACAQLSFENAPDSGLCLLVNRDNHKAQQFYLALGAINAQESKWHAPDGSVVPTYWYVWRNIRQLIEKAYN